MKYKYRRVRMGLVLFAVTALVLLSGKIRFWIFDETIMTTDLAQFLSLEHVKRMAPLFIIIVAAAALIVAVTTFRKIRRVGNEERRGCEHRESGCRIGVNVARQENATYLKVRWAVMILFSITIMFGGIFTGFVIPYISLPVLSCPTNRSQFMESSCYFLAHLPDLFAGYGWENILLFFASTVGFMILLGRTICGFLCPMGLIQDVMHWIRYKLKIEGYVMNDKDYAKLVPVKWLLVILMLGVVFTGASFCNFCPALVVSPVLSGLKVSLYFSGFMMIFVLVGSFFKRRAWCGICPLGLMIGIFHRCSPFRIKKDVMACTECGACYEACPMGIKSIYTERKETDVTDINCILCGECVRCCPEDNALAVTFFGKKLYRASRRKMMSGYAKKER